MDFTQEETLTELLKTCEDTVTRLSPEDNVKNSKFWKIMASDSTAQLTAVPVPSLAYDSALPGATYSNISLTGSPYTFGPDASKLGSNTVWTTSGTGSSPYTINPYTMNQSGKVHITGENADLVIGEKSMRDWMERVEERLNILHPNAKLEAEWKELKSLGEQYRRLEQHIKDKQATWDRLKAMPPPVAE